MASKYEKEIGLDRCIARRDFIHGSSLMVGGVLAGCSSPAAQPDYGFEVGSDWYGPGGVGDSSLSHGNTPGLTGSSSLIIVAIDQAHRAVNELVCTGDPSLVAIEA